MSPGYHSQMTKNPEFWVDLSREEVERLTRDVDEDGWCTGR